MDEEDLVSELEKGNVAILVKANAIRDAIEGYDAERKAWRIAIAAPPEDNKANIAIIKFFSRLVGKPVRIVRGLTSKKKVIAFS